MKKKITLLLLFLSIVGVKAQNNDFWIYLAIGQGNMVGTAKVEAKEATVNDNFVVMQTENAASTQLGTWKKAVSPIVSQTGGYGFLEAFGKTMLENTKNKKIGVVAVADETFPMAAYDIEVSHDFVANKTDEKTKAALERYGNNIYGRLIDMARLAQKDGVIKGILLQQDGNDTYNNAWLQRVKKVYYRVLNDLSLDSTKVPLLIGEVGRSEVGGKYAEANKTIGKMHAVLQHSFVVSAKDCALAVDKVHFTEDGYKQLGRRFALKTLQGMGFELSDTHKSSQSTHTKVQSSVIEVNVQISDKGILTATATEPLVKVSVTDTNGASIKEITLPEPSKVFTMDLNELPQGQIIVAFHAIDGEQSFTISN